MKKRILVAAALASLSLVLMAGSALAEDDTVISFGIRPTEAFADRPETFSYFSHEMSPGQILHDEALVINDGDVPLTLSLYAADAVTAQNGGTAFMHQGQLSPGGHRGVGGWITPSVTEIHLEPGEEMVVPFTIHVPEDAAPGQHIGGLLVEAPPAAQGLSAGEGQAHFAVNVIRRVGVAVVIDVPGPRMAELDINSVILRQQDNQGSTFEIEVSNNGNIYLRAEGELWVMAPDGLKLATIPLSLDTILPGDTTVYHITYPVHLISGDYVLSVFLDHGFGTASLEGVPLSVTYGDVPLEPAHPTTESPSGDPDSEVPSPRFLSVQQIILLAAALFVGAGAGVALILRARKHRRNTY
ncbi:MAG: DUF916 domain-containing protein [Anaerolineales bacterium]|jgi:hypothetical protein